MRNIFVKEIKKQKKYVQTAQIFGGNGEKWAIFGFFLVVFGKNWQNFQKMRHFCKNSRYKIRTGVLKMHQLIYVLNVFIYTKEH